MTWITDFEIMLKKVKSAWMDLLPTIDISNEQFTSVAQQEPAFQNAPSPADQYAVLEDLHARFTSRRNREHARLFFPLGITSLLSCSWSRQTCPRTSVNA